MTARSILVTGCSSGIGRDAALHLHALGWRVFATARTDADLAALRDEGLTALHLDYEDTASIDAALAAVAAATGGRLDALFNNGAYAIPAPLEDMPTDALRAIFEANLIGWHHLTRAAIPLMRQGGGRIVMCSSVLGFVPARWRGAYIATKYALEGYTDTLRLELSDTPIRVVLIQPGPIATDFRRNAILQFERWIDWKASARVDQYRASLLDQLYKGGGGAAFEKGPEAVTRALMCALTDRRPRARYRVTVPTHMMAAARRLLPTRAMDWLCGKA
ncbi:SDR family NAD(P)-dependent oxidoreductase [Meridianimarinicoccus sp. RP-17]|uniref:SDR family NAD(P)-dependent oxidoreductase n=1 Tax=Meridianimarinicoccus zhengii TaxID=2056810 RepID=UPI000DAEC93B|nr:SDR family NAD(P)-dependent oxidoreductase [Phycocomes zhengii]